MLQFLLSLSDESDYEKIEYLFNTYHDYMLRYAITKFASEKRSNCQIDAEDAVQNTFMKVSKYTYNIDFSRGETDVKNYIFSILNNEIINILKNNQDNFEFNEKTFSEKEYSFLDELEIKESYHEIVKAIEDLDEKYSTTLFLVFCKEMTVNRIAEIMGISPKTVYTRLERGKVLLLDSLKGARING